MQAKTIFLTVSPSFSDVGKIMSKWNASNSFGDIQRCLAYLLNKTSTSMPILSKKKKKKKKKKNLLLHPLNC